MPFYEDEENNNPFRPTAEQSTYGYEVTADSATTSNPEQTFGESVSAGFKAENWMYRLSQEGQGERTLFEAADINNDNQNIVDQMASFDPVPHIREQDKGFEDWYSKAANANDVRIIQERIDSQLKNREFVNNGGVGSMLGMVGGAILSPELVIPVIGEASLLAKGKLAANIYKVFAANVAADGIHELINYKTDRTYTDDQLGYAMLGSVVLNGIFGGFAYKSIMKQAKLEKNTNEVIDEIQDNVIDIGTNFDPHSMPLRHAGAAQTAEESYELKADALLRGLHGSGLGKKKSMLLSNNLMGALAKNKAVRKVTGLLYENSFYYKSNASGIATPASVELKLERYKGVIVTAFKKSEKIYKDYMENTADALTKEEFRTQVSIAIRAGTHSDAHVAKAARMYKEKVFNPLGKKAKELKLLDGDLDPKYLMRVWNREAVMASRPLFKEKLVKHFKTKADNAGVEDHFLEDAADATITNILGGDVMSGAIISSGMKGTNPLKGRVLDIPDEMVEEFIENDIEALSKRYVDNMSLAIEKEKFLKENGWEHINDIEVDIRDEYNLLINKTTDAKKIKALEEEKKEAIDFVASAFKRTFGGADDAGAFDPIMNNARKVMTMAKLGRVLLSSMADVGRIHQEFGMTGIGNGIKIMFSRATKGMKKEQYAQLGALTEKVLNTRYNAMMGVDDVTGTGIISRAIDKLYKGFGTLTGISAWNDGVKTMAIYAGEHSILLNGARLASGKKIDNKIVEELARWGISKDVAERIGKQFNKHGETKSGLLSSNFEKWTDTEAFDAFANALTKISLQVINTPTKGALPRIFDKALGKTVMQFKSFQYASHTQTLVPALQTPDAKRLVGTLEMITIGSMVYYAKEHAYNDKPKTGDWKQVIVEGIDRSGVFALPFEINNIVEKATMGTVGVRPAFGLSEAQRMRNVNVFGALAGPLAGASADVAIPLGHMFQGDLTEGDITRMFRVMPYQNLWWTSWMTNQLRDNLKEQVKD